MKSVVTVYKYPSETPLDSIERFRNENPEYQQVTLGYAGRLDPMAEGLLLVLVGEENKKRKTYESLSKEYEFSFIPGIGTDSYDMMGLITSYKKPPATEIILINLSSITPPLIGTFEQPYPPYSSAIANGKRLYYWARRNLLHTVTVPTKNVKINALSFLSVEILSISEIVENAINRIKKVTGDFRQSEIIKGWTRFGVDHKDEKFTIVQYKATVSSGTYIRSLVHGIGLRLGCDAVTYSIIRKKVGSYYIESL